MFILTTAPRVQLLFLSLFMRVEAEAQLNALTRDATARKWRGPI